MGKQNMVTPLSSNPLLNLPDELLFRICLESFNPMLLRVCKRIKGVMEDPYHANQFVKLAIKTVEESNEAPEIKNRILGYLQDSSKPIYRRIYEAYLAKADSIRYLQIPNQNQLLKGCSFLDPSFFREAANQSHSHNLVRCMTALPASSRLLTSSQTNTTLEQASQAAQWLAGHPEAVTERRSLDLRKKNLTEIPQELPLEHVSQIYLDQNRLSVLPARIFESPEVVQISLWNNVLTELPRFSVEISSLQILNLNNNRLQELPPEIWKLPLRTLHLNNNQLKLIPDDVRFSTHLEILSANDNYLHKVSPKIEELASLRQLSLCTNRLSSLTIGTMPSLEILAFSGNHHIQVTIGNLPRLKEFKATSTKISEFPAGLRNSTALEIINIRNNSFRVLPEADLSSWPNLISLDIAYNQLQGLPEAMGRSVKLSTLNLLGNEGCRIPDSMQKMLSQISNLTYPISETSKQEKNSGFKKVCTFLFSYFSSHQTLVL